MTELLSTPSTIPSGARVRRTPDVPLVPLLVVDPDLAEGLRDDELAEARRRVVAPEIVVVPGPWSVAPERPCGVLTLLVLDGFLTRTVTRPEGRFAHLFGPGAAFDPWVPPSAPGAVSWCALTRVRLAVADEGVGRAAAAWPPLLAALLGRVGQWTEHLADVSVAVRLPRIEQRVLSFLWLLADRWGRVAGDGVVVDLPVTHAALGDLVGARRSTVTLALRSLAEAGVVSRRDDGSWLLAPSSRPEAHEPAVGAPPAVPSPIDRVAQSRDRARRAGERAAEAGARSARLHEDLAAMAAAQGNVAQAAQHRAYAAQVRVRVDEYARRHAAAAAPVRALEAS